MKISINGFGRIGRQAFKIALEKPEIDIVAINDLSPLGVLAHLLRFDSVYGKYDKNISIEVDGKQINIEEFKDQKEFFEEYLDAKEKFLIVDGKKFLVISQKDPTLLPWKDLEVDVVLECTGRFTNRADAEKHITAGAKKVIISAPTKDDVPTYLIGVNDAKYNNENVISNASCTTNCVGPVAAVMQSNFGILKAAMTTIHSVTAEQNLVDNMPPALHKDLRRARSALVNIVPTTTGAAISTTKAIPELAGKFDGLSIRVPTLCGSLTDFTFVVGKKTTVEEVNQVFINAKSNPMYKNSLDATYNALVTSDIVKTTYSAIVDLSLTQVIDGDLVKVIAWYDNEWGYSNRLVEMATNINR